MQPSSNLYLALEVKYGMCAIDFKFFLFFKKRILFQGLKGFHKHTSEVHITLALHSSIAVVTKLLPLQICWWLKVCFELLQITFLFDNPSKWRPESDWVLKWFHLVNGLSSLMNYQSIFWKIPKVVFFWVIYLKTISITCPIYISQFLKWKDSIIQKNGD